MENNSAASGDGMTGTQGGGMTGMQGAGMSIGVGIPSVVIGTLIALKKAGMTTMSYTDIFWFGIEVFLVCAFIGFLIWLIIMLIIGVFGVFNKY